MHYPDIEYRPWNERQEEKMAVPVARDGSWEVAHMLIKMIAVGRLKQQGGAVVTAMEMVHAHGVDGNPTTV
ncbi:hypothetical protein GOP47_0017369 [Adiantum capillus-veneris]|uniref:Uncharacterized protein n=1 Tax=Adiantum capillus-veneris TaxID=13818 RepID=A0A9D4UGG4_ADICA|nr:hypothetical protein GOP47_0017369 [Adiantum capillus-veneris]